MSKTSVRRLAEQLFVARRDSIPITIDQPELSLAESYAVQDQVAELTCGEGAGISGWKVGLTSAGAMAMFGAREPIAGRIFDHSLLASGATIDFGESCEARVEGELLIVIGAPPAPPFDQRKLLSSIECIRPAIEVADSRIVGWPSQAAPAVADDACCGWVIAGDARDLGDLDLAEVEMRLTAGGPEVANGRGANCMGNPLNVYRWFLEKAASLGWQIEPGHVLLTGAIAPPVPAVAGTHYEATLTHIGGVEFLFREDGLVRR